MGIQNNGSFTTQIYRAAGHGGKGEFRGFVVVVVDLLQHLIATIVCPVGFTGCRLTLFVKGGLMAFAVRYGKIRLYGSVQSNIDLIVSSE